jgi:tRNA(Ile)-lysidine synthase
MEKSIAIRKLLSRGQSVVVAVSGGLDSMVLLHLLSRFAGVNTWKLAVAHFNHQLRGRSSDADERFVRRTAESLGLTFVSGRGSVKSRARQTGQSVEMAARDLRHAFLARTARRLKSRLVALAHHADDQVELFFLRLLRGAGGEGLAGMKWRSPSPADPRVQLVRPLLDARRADLASFARENNIGFREDASNASLDLLRNRIRRELLPALESNYQPGLAKTVLRTMEITGAEAEYVTESALRWLRARRRTRFSRLPLPVQRRCLQLQMQWRPAVADYPTIEWLRENPNLPISLSSGVSVYRDDRGWIRTLAKRSAAFKTEERRVRLNGGAGETAFAGLRCRWRLVASRASNRRPDTRQCEFFDAGRVGSRIILRHWRPGDRFQPIGMSGAVKLQDWFTNLKIPMAHRRELVLATTARGEIFWVEGLRISERFKLTRSTRRRLIWLWERA